MGYTKAWRHSPGQVRGADPAFPVPWVVAGPFPSPASASKAVSSLAHQGTSERKIRSSRILVTHFFLSLDFLFHFPGVQISHFISECVHVRKSAHPFGVVHTLPPQTTGRSALQTAAWSGQDVAGDASVPAQAGPTWQRAGNSFPAVQVRPRHATVHLTRPPVTDVRGSGCRQPTPRQAPPCCGSLRVWFLQNSGFITHTTGTQAVCSFPRCTAWRWDCGSSHSGLAVRPGDRAVSAQ